MEALRRETTLSHELREITARQGRPVAPASIDYLTLSRNGRLWPVKLAAPRGRPAQPEYHADTQQRGENQRIG